MVLVDDAGGEWPMIGHAPWNGCNLADFVMPFFLFIVGMAIALALKKIPEKLVAIRKVILRTLKLLFWGLLLQGGYFHDLDKLKYGVDMNRIRWCGILQNCSRLLGSVDNRNNKTSPIQRTSNRMVLHIQVILLAMVTCNVRGNVDPPCNAVGYIDREACTKNSPYEGPFRDDAPSCSISAIHSAVVGVHFGHVLIHMKDHSSRLLHWVGMGIAVLVLGIILHFTDGKIRSVDNLNLKYLFLPLEWIGMNAMVVYIVAAGGIFADSRLAPVSVHSCLTKLIELNICRYIGSRSTFSLEYGIQQEHILEALVLIISAASACLSKLRYSIVLERASASHGSQFDFRMRES
ncbi:hypothetical protein RND71_000769 [Anisodus tanguticus]|uniref:Heparan-alpha-glucosaminide N-acetyltransferase n=1 Tax=Anisodus tanguticus TaxID=243964 RepID=A0AAE1VRM0_9SOLA|nr:hypothetical protein RND71_000769 [Anisodus tanguticus]